MSVWGLGFSGLRPMAPLKEIENGIPQNHNKIPISPTGLLFSRALIRGSYFKVSKAFKVSGFWDLWVREA